MKRPPAFLFDLDGVLVDTARLHFKAWSATLKAQLGIAPPVRLEPRLRGLSRADSLALILKAAGVTLPPERFAAILAAKNARYRRLLQRLDATGLLPGAAGLVAQLATVHPLALVSASRNAPLILARTGLTPYFDHVVDPAVIRQGKPAPDIYLAAARALGLRPQDCIGLEDAPAGLLGLKKAGMFAVAVGTDAPADLRVPDLAHFDPAQAIARWQAR